VCEKAFSSWFKPVHCRPVMRGLIMDYAFSDRDL
jgi:hypothetical protein